MSQDSSLSSGFSLPLQLSRAQGTKGEADFQLRQPPWSSAQLSSAQLGAAQPSSALLSSAQPCSAQLGPAQPSSAQLSPAQLSSAQLSAAQLSSAQPSSAQLGPAHLISKNQKGAGQPGHAHFTYETLCWRPLSPPERILAFLTLSEPCSESL